MTDVFYVDNVNTLGNYAPIETLIDPFTSTVNPAVWTTISGTITWDTGRMSLGGTNPSVTTAKAFSLHNSHISMEFVPGAGDSVVIEIRAAASPGSGAPYTVPAGWQITALGKLRAYQTFTPPPASPGYIEKPYDVNLHRWLRITEVGGYTYWETSADGAGWVLFTAMASYSAYLEPVALAINVTGVSTPTPVSLGHAMGAFSFPLEQVQFNTDAFLDAEIATMVDLGVGWMRGDYPVSLVSPTSGTFDYSAADHWITRAIAAGIKPVPVLYQLPTWMNGSANDKTPPSSDTAFASWCATACAHLYGLGVRYVEIWNEQNLAGFWNMTVSQANFPDRYHAMMSHVYPAIKAAVPSMNVILGGISTADSVYTGTANGAYNTMVRYGDLGTFAYCDAVAWHPYVEDDPPCSVVDLYPMLGLPAVQAVLTQMDRVKPGMQLWTTETGCSRFFIGSQAAQRDRAHATYAALMPGGCLESVKDRLGPLFWFCVRDRNPADTGADPREDSFGFASNDGVTHYLVYADMKTYWGTAWPGASGGTASVSFLDNVNVASPFLSGGRSTGLGSTVGTLTITPQNNFDFKLEFWDVNTSTWVSDPDCDIRAISLDRGRAKYLDATAAGQISVSIANFQGKWSGWNPDAFWASVSVPATPTLPLRFTATPTRLRLALVGLADDGTVFSTGPYSTMFTGTLDSIVDSWPGTTDAVVTIQATDGFKDLARYADPGNGTVIPATTHTGSQIDAIATRSGWPTNGSPPGWLPVPRRIDTGLVALQASDLQGVALDNMRRAAESEWGWLYMDVDGALTFLDRNAVTTNARMANVQWVFTDSDAYAGTPIFVCYEDIQVRIDSDTIINIAQITPAGLPLVQITDSASIAAYGPKTWTRTDLPINTIADAGATAALVVTEYADDEKRVESLTFEAAFGNTNHARVAAGLRLNDRIRVFRQFLSGDGAVAAYLLVADLLVMGIHHEITAGGADPGGNGYTAVQSWKVTIRTATAVDVGAWGKWDVSHWDLELDDSISEWGP